MLRHMFVISMLLALQLHRTYGNTADVNDLIGYAKALLGKLTTKSSSLNWKVEDIQKEVSTLKCGFDSLKKDVAVLESASSELLHLSSEIEPCLEEHIKETEKQLHKVEKSVEDKKSAANIVEEFTHPCGGSGWTLAVYRDFRDPDTDCPAGWEQTFYPERPHTCGKSSSGGGCDFIEFPETVGLEYSKVCGRIKAYQHGTPNGRLNSFVGLALSFFVPIWLFGAGMTQSQNDPSLSSERCPCDGGDPLQIPPLETFYFCESLIEEDSPGSMYDNHFFSKEVLWDENGCSSTGDCCSRFDSPYFVRHFSFTTTFLQAIFPGVPPPFSPLRMIAAICTNDDKQFENFAIELIEIYVK